MNAYLDSSSGFHAHATALHQTVFSSSLESVKLLVDSGADLTATDLVYDSTPLDWAQYMQTEEKDELKIIRYKEIESFLSNKMKK